MAVNIDLEKLLEAGAHFGHQTKRWNPKMGPYIYGVKDGVSVFDLIKTKDLLAQALNVLADAVKNKRLVLFVGTKRQAKDKIKLVAQATNSPFVDERWLGGTLTNFEQVKASRTAGEYKEYTKKERLLIDRDIEKLEKTVGGLELLDRIPDVVFIVDTHKEHSAVAEAVNKGVEIIGLVDTNADPTDIDWPIPMNDDASAAVEYVLDLVQEAMTSVKPKPKKEVKKAGPKKKAAKKTSKKAKTKGTKKKG